MRDWLFPESPAARKLGIIFHEKAILAGQTRFAETIGHVVKSDISMTRAQEIADILVGGLLGHRVFAILLGRAPLPSRDEIAAKIGFLLGLLKSAWIQR